MSKEDMIEEIKKMTVVELADLVKAIEEEFGVSAVAAAAPAAGAAAGAAAEEKTSFNVVLKEAGDSKNKSYQSCKRCNRIRIKRSKRISRWSTKNSKRKCFKRRSRRIKSKIYRSWSCYRTSIILKKAKLQFDCV